MLLVQKHIATVRLGNDELCSSPTPNFPDCQHSSCRTSCLLTLAADPDNQQVSIRAQNTSTLIQELEDLRAGAGQCQTIIDLDPPIMYHEGHKCMHMYWPEMSSPFRVYSANLRQGAPR